MFIYYDGENVPITFIDRLYEPATSLVANDFYKDNYIIMFYDQMGYEISIYFDKEEIKLYRFDRIKNLNKADVLSVMVKYNPELFI